MTRHPIALLAVALFAACGEQQPAPPARRPALKPAAEQRNLLNAGYGAAVVSRTAELTLENSALHAIDGDPVTAWSAPPADPQQTLIFSLPAGARIDRLGVMTRQLPSRQTRVITFSVSEDGKTYRSLPPFQTAATDAEQLFDAAVPRARYVRIDVNEGGTHFTVLHSIYVRGEWLEPPSLSPIAGCWTINGFEARFVEVDGRIAGVIDGEETTLFDGGQDDATYRVTWATGPQWGEGLLTLSPDGTRLSGLRWHEEPTLFSVGSAWFGERKACTPAPVDASHVLNRFISGEGWYPLFAIRFDDEGMLLEQESEGGLDVIDDVLRRAAAPQRIKLVSRELRGSSAEENRRRAEARLQSLRAALTKRGTDLSRIDLEALGSASPRHDAASVATRSLYSVIEIQVPAAVRSAF